MQKVLSVGSGPKPAKSAKDVELIRLDIDPAVKPDVLGDVIGPLAFPDDTFDRVVASHIIEHLPRLKVMDALHEWKRVLKPKGILEIHTPDLGWAAVQVLTNKENYILALAMIFGQDEPPAQQHHCGFTLGVLRGIVEMGLGMRIKRAQQTPFYMKGEGRDPVEYVGITILAQKKEEAKE